MTYILIFIFSFCAISNEIDGINEDFISQNYAFVIEKIDSLEKNKKIKSKADYATLLLLRGHSYLELNEFKLAKKNLLGALKFGVSSKELNYLLGQTYFSLEEYDKARFFFKKSIENGFKRAVSLYYAGFSSHKLGDNKTAVALYTSIKKLPKSERKIVEQAALFQVADIYFVQAAKLPGAFQAMKEYVIPQYQKAVEVDSSSELAVDINKRIIEIQQKYELVLFQMRNGRVTAIPPFFLKASFSTGFSSNANQAEDLDEKESSLYGVTSLYSRYSFYPNSKYSIAPDLNIAYQKFLNKEDEVQSNNNYSASLGLNINYEHFAFTRAATTFFRLGFTHGALDVNSDNDFADDSNSIDLSLSEQIEFIKESPTILRLLYNQVNDKDDSRDLTSISFVGEQLLYFKYFTNYFFLSYDQIRYAEDSNQDTNSFLLRNDFLFSSVKGWFNLGIFFSYSQSNFINDDTREFRKVTQFGLNLNRPLSNKWFISADIIRTSEKESTSINSNEFILSFDFIY